MLGDFFYPGVKYESLHVGGLMLGNQVNGWGHWGLRVGGLLGKAGHNNNIGGVLPDQLDSNTARHICKQT